MTSACRQIDDFVILRRKTGRKTRQWPTFDHAKNVDLAACYRWHRGKLAMASMLLWNTRHALEENCYSINIHHLSIAGTDGMTARLKRFSQIVCVQSYCPQKVSEICPLTAGQTHQAAAICGAQFQLFEAQSEILAAHSGPSIFSGRTMASNSASVT